MWTRISKGLTIAVTVMSVLFLGIAALTSAVSTNWKARATKEYPEGFPKSEITKQQQTITELNADIKKAEDEQQAAIKAIEADTLALTAPDTGREAQLQAEILQLIDQAHEIAVQVEAEAKKVQARQDEDTRLREEVIRLKSQYEDLIDQKQTALANVQRLRDLLFQARGVLERVQRRKAALEEYDPRPSARRTPILPRERDRG